jgi:hypothetical protein
MAWMNQKKRDNTKSNDELLIMDLGSVTVSVGEPKKT